jgi:hypothetical protein
MQTAALIIAVLLAVIIILLIILLLRTRRLSESNQQIFLEEQEADEETPIVVYAAAPAISRYPLFDLRRQPPGMLNIPPPPSRPLLFNHPNGARLGRGPHYYS